MRNRKTLTVILFGLIFGISGAAYVKNKEHKRHPASIITKGPWQPIPIEKHLTLLKVEIGTPENIPESGNDDVTLTGRILVNRELSGDLNYNWDLPEGVHAVEGQVSDALANVKAGQVVELKLTVSGFNKEKQRLISLQAKGESGNLAMGNSAIIASRPEDTWEAVATDMKKSADEQLGTSRPSRGGK